ncbi:lipopolysaccharide biosynthesis protein [Thiothrix lacustris]|uniref:Lipopolysaccharide biosynthesis protein n=1 Tax=Thiothrix lacustris TaxID=525917 RepID=A0ABY9MP46_9GAMM|nr:lipopolysaccharide biosynthesis protein [Thiothrix lacustris]WML90404.1 lipopolysaccharide biosynthesis protein [Thiothrix lacustris]
MKNIKTKAIYGFAWSITDKLFSQLGHLAVTIYLARLIGPEKFGFVGVLTIFMLLAESVVSSGFTQALVQRSHQLTKEDASTIFYVNFGWSMLMYALLYISAPWIADFFHQPELVDISRILFLVIIINSLAVVVRAKLTIKVDFKSQAIASTVATLLSAILAIFLAQHGYSYWALVWLIISKSLFASIGIWLFCRWLPQWRFSMESFRSLFKFGSNLMFAGFVATLVNNLYVALIGRFYDATQVGYFTQASNLSNYLSQFISSSLQGVTYPIMTSIKEDRERLINVYKQLISITMLVSLPLLVGFAAISDDFVRLLLGDEWKPVVPVLIALSIARTITPISSINMNILNAIGRSDLFLKVDLSKLPLALGTLYIALPHGIEGVAWAMVCTSFIAFFINAYFPGKLFGFGAIKQLKVATHYIIASVIMFVIIINLPVGENLIGLFTKIIVGAVVYTLYLLVVGDNLLHRGIRKISSKLITGG